MLDKQMCISMLRQFGFCLMTDEKCYKEFLSVYPSIRDNSPVYQVVIMDVHPHKIEDTDKFFVTINGWCTKPTGIEYSKSLSEIMSYKEGLEKIFNTRNFPGHILDCFRYIAWDMLYNKYPEENYMTVDELKEHKSDMYAKEYKHAELGIHSKVDCVDVPDEILVNDKKVVEEHIGYYSDMNPRKPKEKLEDV